LLGLGGFLLKDQISAKLHVLEKMSAVTETAVGVSLLLIGILGIKENIKAPEEKHVEDTETAKSIRSLFVNGFLHGFSWDGAPSLAPALAMNTWKGALSFLLAYSFGTTLIMSATAAAVGESTLRLGKVVQNRNLTRNLSIGCSVLAILVGAFWIFNVLF
jgi:cytochrome c biogenesis protein CcdA